MHVLKWDEKNAGKQPKVTKKIRQYCSDLVENIDLGENLKKKMQQPIVVS